MSANTLHTLIRLERAILKSYKTNKTNQNISEGEKKRNGLVQKRKPFTNPEVCKERKLAANKVVQNKSKGEVKVTKIMVRKEHHSKKNHKERNVTKQSSHSAKKDLTEIKDRNKFFKRLLEEMAKEKKFRDLSSLLHNYMQKIQSFSLPKGKHQTVKEVIHTQRDVDEYSFNITPFDIPGNHTFIARAIIGDGNCMFCTGSILCHGHENDYKELKVRVIAELCIHEEQYLDPDFLGLGHEARNDYAEKYSKYTQQYTAER